MSSPLPEGKLEKLLPALKPLAELIGGGALPGEPELSNILSSLGIKDTWALDELRLWSIILQKARSMRQHEGATRLLMERGIQQFPAILTIDEAIRNPFCVEPKSIDFGRLDLGQGASTTLTVSGGRVKAVEVPDSKLKVDLPKPDSGVTRVKVILSGSSAVESLRAAIILHGDYNDLQVSIKAKWELVPLFVEPQSIDFGLLRLRQGGNATLKVTGGVVRLATVGSDRLKITLHRLDSGDTQVKVALSGSSEVDSVKDTIILQGDYDKLKVPVSARWESEKRHEIEKLIRQLESPNWLDRNNSAYHLGNDGDPVAVIPLIKLHETDHEKWNVNKAKYALGKIYVNDPRGFQKQLIEALKNELPSVRKYAAEALKKMGWDPSGKD